jgi:mono/diheme cytochrome c family protein
MTRSPGPLLPAAVLACLGLCAACLVLLPPDTCRGEEWTAPSRSARKKNPVPADEKSLAVGKQLYTKECQSCHGVTGKGDGPAAGDLKVSPGNLTDPKMWQQTDGALFWKITEGKKPMPSMEKTWTEEQRWHVVNYIRTLAPRPKEAPK